MLVLHYLRKNHSKKFSTIVITILGTMEVIEESGTRTRAVPR